MSRTYWRQRWRKDWRSGAKHAGRVFRHSLRWRLVALFLLLAFAMTGIFLGGMQKALSVGWREAVQPLLADYVDRLAADIGSPPDLACAQALVQRLPISVRITGPVVNWDSHPEKDHGKHTEKYAYSEDTRLKTRSLERTTADGHRIRFGLGDVAWENQPRRVGGITLVVLLLLTALAYAYVRRLLRPLDDIRQGAERFGAGDFSHTIPLRHRDELGDLAQRINTMAHELQQMLDAKRALLLAISHELRSPLTRARLNVELLPETEDTQPLRAALLRDLAGMRDLINDLMESERLAGQHAVLSREVTDVGALAQEVVHELLASLGGVSQTIMVDIAPNMPLVSVDRARMRLLIRNLLDNALRHSAGATLPPELYLRRIPAGVELQVRDHGPGVAEDQLPHLAQAFYRADSARQRATGGVGLGLYLCRLVALAHGGTWAVRNAAPGLEITVKLPLGL